MGRKKRSKGKPRPEDWIVETEIRINNREVEPGTELTFRDHFGQRRRARFIEKVTTPTAQWITVREWGSLKKGPGPIRSITEDKVITVHRIDKFKTRKERLRIRRESNDDNE